jgi:hypothetical protein
MTKTCKVCAKPFLAEHNWAVYCSPGCARHADGSRKLRKERQIEQNRKNQKKFRQIFGFPS